MTVSLHAPLTAIGSQLRADYRPMSARCDRVINASRAAVAVSRSSKPTADVVCSAGRLAAVTEIWRRFKKDMFDPYRPELHYMRGPGPKSRERARA
jgi:hypothetical protein